MKKIQFEDYVHRFMEVHGDKYSYSCNAGIVGCKVTIRCPTHGVFIQNIQSHLNGHGCPLCGMLKRSLSKSISFEDWVARFHAVHGNRYSYSKKIGIVDGRITVRCPDHGVFEQGTDSHWRGNGLTATSRKWRT